jgi:hypothetical protein
VLLDPTQEYSTIWKIVLCSWKPVGDGADPTYHDYDLGAGKPPWWKNSKCYDYAVRREIYKTNTKEKATWRRVLPSKEPSSTNTAADKPGETKKQTEGATKQATPKKRKLPPRAAAGRSRSSRNEDSSAGETDSGCEDDTAVDGPPAKRGRAKVPEAQPRRRTRRGQGPSQNLTQRLSVEPTARGSPPPQPHSRAKCCFILLDSDGEIVPSRSQVAHSISSIVQASVYHIFLQQRTLITHTSLHSRLQAPLQAPLKKLSG